MGFIGLKKPKEQLVKENISIGDKLLLPQNIQIENNHAMIFFIRHIGCPFAEATLKMINERVTLNPTIDYIIISHGNHDSYFSWLKIINIDKDIKHFIDSDRIFYGNAGLGFSSISHFLSFKPITGVLKLLLKGIKNRSAEGTRWQKAGTFLIKKDGTILWNHIPQYADELPSIDRALKVIEN